MQMSAKGRAALSNFEGCVLRAYQDSVGIWTIGVGHTAAAGPPVPRAGMTISAAEADAILTGDLRRFEVGVERLARVPLTQGQFDALVSFAFNVGLGALENSTLLRKLNAGDYAAAALEFMRWDKAGGRRLAGLTRRRAAEAAMFRGQ